ncbi:MAG: cupin domain-containing protein [Halobacteriovoraceae bacterium]|nr:cupin domain-containing protein [Halobacteriovoraceae bacterium]MCB9095680.1 cupin domain-containing protein [Halobacteriovoraceae bacterium]
MKTRFGELAILLKEDNKILLEHIKFETAGRAHQHKDFETFVVLKGKGKVVSGDQTFSVKAGDMVSIPPLTDHWMIPEGKEPLEGFIWYQEDIPQNLNA